MSLRVLVVTSDGSLKRLIVPLVEAAGLTAVATVDVSEAQRAIEEAPVALAIVDRDQPDGQSAFVFLRQINSSPTPTRVVIVCAGSSPEDLIAGFRLGAVDVIRKPTRLGVLHALLVRHVGAAA